VKGSVNGSVRLHDVLGPILIVFVVVIAIPVALLMTGAVAVAIIGAILRRGAETSHEGSELIDLS
jgi:hypothetical protein